MKTDIDGELITHARANSPVMIQKVFNLENRKLMDFGILAENIKSEK